MDLTYSLVRSLAGIMPMELKARALCLLTCWIFVVPLDPTLPLVSLQAENTPELDTQESQQMTTLLPPLSPTTA